MAGFVDTTIREIDGRLAQLRDEIKRLEAARAALVSPRSDAPRAASAAPARRRGPGRPRGSRGGNTRAKEALELVRVRPGITIPEIASELSILPNYLYRVMPRLVAEGQILRDGQGWFPVASGASAPASETTASNNGNGEHTTE
jgi:hypothetical protein